MMTLLQQTRQRAILAAAHVDYQKGLNQHSFFKVNNRALSADLVQDTFVKTWSYLAKGGKIEVMKAFLYHVLNNLIVDEYRKRKTVSLDAMLEIGLEPKPTQSLDIAALLDGKAAIALIKQLPEKYQNIIRMRYTQNLSITEMAILTGQTKNTMSVQVHRGLEKLKALYALAS